MRTVVPAQPQFVPYAKQPLPRCLRLLFLSVLTAGTLCAAGQQPASQKASPQAAARKPVHHRKRPAPATPTTPVSVAPPAPKLPDWPVNDHPTDATVVWNSQGLRIEASNSSLKQILKDVAASTGIGVQGLATDERIFGVYGPGKARDILAKLLDGSGYNVLMIGDQGEGTPRQILLSTQPKGDAPPAANGQPPAATAADPQRVHAGRASTHSPANHAGDAAAPAAADTAEQPAIKTVLRG